MSGYLYRAKVYNPGYACDPGVFTSNALLTILPDHDNDGIPDEIDVDDDNDGILDTKEDTTDIDNDGIPNHFDLDSDGDGCYDVLEAGFEDPDGDGILCTSPVRVNNIGQVIGCSTQACAPLNILDYNAVGDAGVAYVIEHDSSISKEDVCQGTAASTSFCG